MNDAFRTLRGPENTMIMGSSMGGLISLHLLRTYPDVFGACGCLSTHFVFSAAHLAQATGEAVPEGVDAARPLIDGDVAAGAIVPPGVRMWFDYGTETLDATYEARHQRVRDWLEGQGFALGRDFEMRRYEGAAHNEAAWRARLDDTVVFLLGIAQD